MDVRICLQTLERDVGFIKRILGQLSADFDENCVPAISRVSGGTTNHLFRIQYETRANEAESERKARSKLLRVFGEGSEKWIDRRKENVAFDVLAAHDLSPRCEVEFANGRIEEFLEDAEPLKHTDFVDPRKQLEICRLMTTTHTLRPAIATDVVLWSGLANMLRQLEEKAAHGLIEDGVVEARTGMSVGRMRREADLLAQYLVSWSLDALAALDVATTSQQSPTFQFAACSEAANPARARGASYGLEVVFAHNDVNPGNLLEVKGSGRLYLIDHEYAGYNHRAFDIANHFCEYAGFTGDYRTLYPSKEQQLQFLRCYLAHALESEEMDDEFLEGFQQIVDAFALSSHLYWAVWAVLQASVSSVEFDFLAYAKQRIDGYVWHKEAIGATRFWT